MGSFLSKVTTERKILPPRMCIYGGPGAGKTTMGASLTDALFVPVEDGLGVLNVAHTSRPDTFEDLMAILSELGEEMHAFKTLVLDSIDQIEPMVWDLVCREGKKPNIESFGYGKGYKLADKPWQTFFNGLDALRDQGMMTVILSHDHTKNIDDTIIGTHARTSPKLHERANDMLFSWCDVMGWLTIERRAVEKGQEGRTTRTARATVARQLWVEDNGTCVAKNRYGLPSPIAVPLEDPSGELLAELRRAVFAQPDDEEAA